MADDFLIDFNLKKNSFRFELFYLWLEFVDVEVLGLGLCSEDSVEEILIFGQDNKKFESICFEFFL